MRFITLVFTMIAFAAFGMAAHTMAANPVLPAWVESQPDPPDCTQTTIVCVQEIRFPIQSTSLDKATAARLSPFQSTPYTERSAAFGYRCFVSAGGVGRIQRCFVYRDTIARGRNESI